MDFLAVEWSLMYRVNVFVRSYVKYLDWRDNFQCFFTEKYISRGGALEHIFACSLQPQESNDFHIKCTRNVFLR